jgi:hypothetical protein
MREPTATDKLSQDRADSIVPSRVSPFEGDVSQEAVRPLRLNSWKQPEWGTWTMTELKAAWNVIGGKPQHIKW